MAKLRRGIDRVSMQEAELVDGQYAIFLAHAEQIFSWSQTKDCLSKHQSLVNRLLSLLHNKRFLEDSDKNDAAAIFFSIWYFGHICLDERYTDDCLNQCLCLLSPSTCISYSVLLDSLNKSSDALAELIENGDVLEAAQLNKQTANTDLEQGQNDLF